MGDPLHPRGVADADRRLDDGNPRPPGPDENLHFELETPGPNPETRRLRQRIDAHPALGVGQNRPAGAPDPEVREFPPEAARPGDILPGHPLCRPITMGLRPLGIARIRLGISAGSCWPSASSVTAQSAFPARAAKPVRRAAPLPRFSSWRIIVIPPIVSSRSAVSSVEPSSTTQTGKSSARARSITETTPPAWL